MTNENLLPWLDLETFGLDGGDPILQVGIIITDLDLNQVAAFEMSCWEPGYEFEWGSAPSIVREMHGGEGGLVERARHMSNTRRETERQAIKFLSDYDATGLPICGNSVGQDKLWLGAQMPYLLDAFHYRVIDVSTLKELCSRYNKSLFERSPAKKLAHTALADLRESIEEFRFYKENFLETDRW